MCPNCPKHCPYTRLFDSCKLSEIAYMVDNNSTTIFSIFMAFWGKPKSYSEEPYETRFTAMYNFLSKKLSFSEYQLYIFSQMYHNLF